MKRVLKAVALGLCLLLYLAPGAQASTMTLKEVYNEFDSWSDGTWYATQVALQYVPLYSYDLGRVEFFTGGTKTGVTIALRPDAAGYPSTTILASGLYDSSGHGLWQGVDFAVPYHVIAGNTYWVTWYFTDGLESPYAGGTTRTVRWGEGSDINYYPNLYTGAGFKTKFYEAGAPEPVTGLLLGLGFAGVGLLKRFRS